MDHKTVYDSLITRARGRVLEGYSEKHHVVPKCVGGTNALSNIVRLTPEEHFVAHQLLVHIYPDHPRLAFGLLAMSMSNRGMRTKGNKLFGWMRRRMGEATRQMKRGIPRSAEVREKISRAKRGRPQPPEAVEKTRLALTGKPKTPEHNAKVSAANKGRPGTMTGRKHSEATKAKISAANAGRKMSPEAVQRATESQSPEQRSAQARKAWVTKRARGTDQPTPTARANMSAGQFARHKKPKAGQHSAQLTLF